MNASELKHLLNIIEKQLDWGDPSTWQSKDFEILNEVILEKTRVSLSASTLRRLWGRVEYNHLPSGTTLDTLARFADFESWRAFTKRGKEIPALLNPYPEIKQVVANERKKSGWLIKAALVAAGIVVISLLGIYAKRTVPPPKGNFVFNLRPVTRSIPNSVIFTYDVKTNPGDLAFIQQSWDPDTRVTIDKNKHQYTSVYFRPGFYHAKLGVNNKVVKEQLLMVPTTGWLGLIANHPIPVYLDNKEFLNSHGLHIATSVIVQKNVPLGPQPPQVEYYNVGNFEPVSLREFSFTCEIKNNFHQGAAACQFARILLFTDNTPVIIELSAKGCVSDLRLLNGGYFMSGKDNDLSGFGTNLSQWTKVTCKCEGSKIQYYINDKLAFESPRPLYNESIIGIGYHFQGTGEVRKIKLGNGKKTIFSEF